MAKTEISPSDSSKKKTTRRVTKTAAVDAASAAATAASSAAPSVTTSSTVKPAPVPAATRADERASTNPGPDAIARRAFELWRARGCRMGGEEQQRNWLEAERQLADERSRGPAQN